MFSVTESGWGGVSSPCFQADPLHNPTSVPPSLPLCGSFTLRCRFPHSLNPAGRLECHHAPGRPLHHGRNSDWQRRTSPAGYLTGCFFSLDVSPAAIWPCFFSENCWLTRCLLRIPGGGVGVGHRSQIDARHRRLRATVEVWQELAAAAVALLLPLLASDEPPLHREAAVSDA